MVFKTKNRLQFEICLYQSYSLKAQSFQKPFLVVPALSIRHFSLSALIFT